MALEQDIVQVTISLLTTPVTQLGFGTPIFASEHRWFTERVREYTSIESVAEDIPVDSPEYAAALGFLSADASPSVIKIGRRTVDSIEFTPDAATGAGQVYTVTVTGTDGTPSAGSYTSVGADTPTVIATALVASLGAVTGVTITDNTGSFSVAATVPTVDNYTVGNISTNVTAVYTTTETAGAMLTAIEQVDNEWYFMTSNDHSADFISTATTGMADAIEAREKLFFFSSQAEDSLDAYDPDTVTDTSDDVLGWVAKDQRFRTVGLFHHEADTTFPECNYISRFAPKDPGTTTWTQKNIKVSLSQDPATGYVLSATQRSNLDDRNANFIQSQGGVAIVRTGKTAGGERISTMRFRDFLVARLTEALQLKQINSEKIPYTDSGINEIRSVVKSVLNRYVTAPGNPQGLQENDPYTTDFPRVVDVPVNDRINGILNASFTGFLAGSIRVTKIQGVLTFEGLTV